MLYICFVHWELFPTNCHQSRSFGLFLGRKYVHVVADSSWMVWHWRAFRTLYCVFVLAASPDCSRSISSVFCHLLLLHINPLKNHRCQKTRIRRWKNSTLATKELLFDLSGILISSRPINLLWRMDIILCSALQLQYIITCNILYISLLDISHRFSICAGFGKWLPYG